MSNLLTISRVRTQALKKGNALPVAVDFKVPAELAPYLVTSSKGVVWVETAKESPDNGTHIFAAVRVATPGEVFLDLVKAVAERGLKDGWGNVHPFTETGLRDAIAHVDSYELGDLEILMAPEVVDIADVIATLEARLKTEANPEMRTKIETRLAMAKARKQVPQVPRPEWATMANLGLPIRPTSWLPPNMAVVVPIDREFVGGLTHLSPKQMVAVAHNAARGIGIAVGA